MSPTMSAPQPRVAWSDAPDRAVPGAVEAAPALEAEDEEEFAAIRGRWLNDDLVLKQKQLSMERHVRVGLDSIKNKAADRHSEFHQLAALGCKVEIGKLSDEMKDGLSRVRASVRHLQEILDKPAQTDSYVVALERQMDACETEIESMKIHQNQDFENLTRVEKLLTREIEAFHRRVEGSAWADAEGAGSSRRPASASASTAPGRGRKTDFGRRLSNASRQDVLPEVIEYEEFTRMHGETGGWTEDEHKEFTRLYHRCGQSYTRTLSACLVHLAYLSREDIVNHCKWDAKHKDLLIRRRTAIQAWREQRNGKRAKSARRRTEELESEEVAKSVEAMRREAQARQEEEEEKRRQVQRWRAEKEVEEERRRQARQKTEARARARAAADKKKKREDATRKLHEYQKRKRIEAEMKKAKERMDKENRKPKTVSAEDLRYLWERDKMLVKQRQGLRMRQELERKELEARQKRIAASLQVVAPRDPARLLRTTESLRAIEREGPDAYFKEANYINRVMRRACPTWRADLKGVV